MNDLCIETKSLHKNYKNKRALKDFSLKVEKGGIHAIIGSNGAGKSTLFRILLGVESATSGSSHIFGVDSRKLSTLIRGQVGFVNEEHTLPSWMSVRAVKQMQQSLYPGWNEDIYQNIFAYFEIDNEQKVSALSRGERAGFNLSIALAQGPKLLLLDEPTLGLDVVARSAFLDALLFMKANHDTTTIFCSHQLDEVKRIADKLIIMEKGCLRNNSTPDDFCSKISYWTSDWNEIDNHIQGLRGLLSHQNVKGQQHLIMINQDSSFEEKLKSKGARNIEKLPVNLETAVNAFLTTNHNKSANTIGDHYV